MFTVVGIVVARPFRCHPAEERLDPFDRLGGSGHFGAAAAQRQFVVGDFPMMTTTWSISTYIYIYIYEYPISCTTITLWCLHVSVTFYVCFFVSCPSIGIVFIQKTTPQHYSHTKYIHTATFFPEMYKHDYQLHRHRYIYLFDPAPHVW